MNRRARTTQASARRISWHMSSTIILPPRAQLCIRYRSNKQQQQQYHHRFSQTERFGFIVPTIVDNLFVNRFVIDSTENETKKFGLEKPLVIWD